MDKFVTRIKRKSPPPITELNESIDVPEEKKMKQLLRTDGGSDEKTANNLGQLLPTIKRDTDKAISDEDLEKLFLALCGNTGKDYDSDDSIISEIDKMDAEEIAAKDKRFREVFASISTMSDEYKRVKAILNIGNETTEEKEARRKLLREMKAGLETKEEKEEAEKKRIKKQKKLNKKLNTIVNVFETDVGKKKADKSDLPLITCSTFARLLELMTEIVPDDRQSDILKIEHRKTIKEIDSNAFEKEIKSMGIKSNFYRENKNISDYIKKKLRKMFLEEQFLDVFDPQRYGFEFNTKECLLALENYYSLNKPSVDNGSSSDALSINIRKFIKSCFHVARSGNPSFVLNDTLKYVLFG